MDVVAEARDTVGDRHEVEFPNFVGFQYANGHSLLWAGSSFMDSIIGTFATFPHASAAGKPFVINLGS